MPADEGAEVPDAPAVSINPRDPYSAVRAAASAAWLSLSATELEVRKYFRTIAVPSGLEALAKMRKQCDLAAETLQQRMDEGNTERCSGCDKTLEEARKSQWIMQGSEVDSDTGVPMPYRYCAYISLLVEHFLEKYNTRIHKQSNPVQGVSPEAMEVFLRHDWPGNVRELENTVERLVVLSTGPYLKSEDLAYAGLFLAAPADSIALDLKDLEREHIRRTLEKFGGHRSDTARALGIDRKTLREKLKRYNILSLSQSMASSPASPAPRTAAPLVLAYGAATLAGQVLILREILVLAQGQELKLALGLWCWLVWTGLGSLLGGWLAGRRPVSPATLASLLAVLALLLPGTMLLARALPTLAPGVIGQALPPLSALFSSWPCWPLLPGVGLLLPLRRRGAAGFGAPGGRRPHLRVRGPGRGPGRVPAAAVPHRALPRLYSEPGGGGLPHLDHPDCGPAPGPGGPSGFGVTFLALAASLVLSPAGEIFPRDSVARPPGDHRV